MRQERADRGGSRHDGGNPGDPGATARRQAVDGQRLGGRADVPQAGLALLLRDRLARAMRRPVAWAAVAMVNLSAMTLFIWHETALVTVSSLGMLAGRVPGLLTAPASGLWVAERLAWLPVFAIVLADLWLTFHRVERG